MDKGRKVLKKNTTIKVDIDTWRALQRIKSERLLNKLSDVIRELLENAGEL